MQLRGKTKLFWVKEDINFAEININFIAEVKSKNPIVEKLTSFHLVFNYGCKQKLNSKYSQVA